MREYTCRGCQGTFNAANALGALPKWCPECYAVRLRQQNREKMARWRQRHPEKVKELNDRYNAKYSADPEHLRRRRENWARKAYGLEPEQLRELEEKQGGVCAICKGQRNGPGYRLHIDHCHDSLRVRGLLCGKCNTMIGLANDDPAILSAAITYLKEN